MPKNRLFCASFLALALLASFAASNAFAEDAPRAGSWTKKSVRTSGSWRIITEGDRQVVVLGDDFKTSKAPDLKIFLSPLPLEEVGNKNAVQGSLLVGKLTSYKGGQRLLIPAGTDLGKYKSLLLHCEQYTKLFAAAAL